jgi:nitroreductase
VVEAFRRSVPIQRSTMAFARVVHHAEVIVSAAILCTATMLLATHSIGMGAGPVSSFSRAAARAVLRLPDRWVPELVLCLCHPEPIQPPAMAPRRRLRWQDLMRWIPE